MNHRQLCVILGILFFLCPLMEVAEAGAGKPGGQNGIQVAGSYRAFLANNVFNYYCNNGSGSYNNYRSDPQGFEFPAGSSKTLIYEDGVVWAGYSKGSSKALVGGSTYDHGLQAGKILTSGTGSTSPVADNAALPKYTVYSVRRAVSPAASLSDPLIQKLLARDSSLLAPFVYIGTSDLIMEYVQDWLNWPAADGAPFQDLNHNGVYDPYADIPGVRGADQTLWYVANDVNAALTNSLAGSQPIGIEMQKTIYGVEAAGALGSCIVSSTRIVNKSGAKIDSMYIAHWCDPDVGNPGDDLVGCDTLLGLGYACNGGSSD